MPSHERLVLYSNRDCLSKFRHRDCFGDYALWENFHSSMELELRTKYKLDILILPWLFTRKLRQHLTRLDSMIVTRPWALKQSFYFTSSSTEN